MTPQVDLHGVRYEDVEHEIDLMVFRHDPPFRIITGNSREMKRQALIVLYEYAGLDTIVEQTGILVLEAIGGLRNLLDGEEDFDIGV